MKVKRYVAPSSREAMAQVKKELGPDAVILSNRAAPGGVEILALAQDDVAGLVAAPAPRPGLEERAQRERLQQQRNPVPRVLDQEAGAALPLKQFAARVESGTVYGGAPASPARRAAVQAATVNKPASSGRRRRSARRTAGHAPPGRAAVRQLRLGRGGAPPPVARATDA